MTDLVVNLALIAVGTLAVLPLVTGLLEGHRARTAAEQVASAMHLARQYAVSNSATYTVTVTSGTVSIACTASCPPGTPADPPVTVLHGATASGSSIGFGPLGTAAPTGTVTVSYPGAASWQVRVMASGRIRTCKPSCS